MADFDKPISTDNYATWPALLKSRLEDIATWFQADAGTNVPTDAKRWNDTNKNWENWSGSAWVALATQYAIDVATVGTRSVSYLLARANHTGSQLSSTISDLQTAITGNTNVAANTAARHSHSNKTTLDAITAAFTSTMSTKLTGIEENAKNDQTKSEIDALGINATQLSGQALAVFGRLATAQTWTARNQFNGELALYAGYSEDADSVGAGGAITINTANATYFYTSTLTSVPTFTFSGMAASGRVTSFILELNKAGTYTPVWNGNIDWPDNTTPEWTTGKDIVTFVTRNGGATWLGFPGGLGMA